MSLLVVGLGNPGKKYAVTRHNIGFQVLDFFLGTVSWKEDFKGLYFKDERAVFLKPQTYMNLSGFSVSLCRSFFKCEKILVLHDEIDFPLGRIQFKFGGSNAGHNGLRSISEQIPQDYYRLRIGIGKELPVDQFVLSPFNEDIKFLLEKSSEALKDFFIMNFSELCQKYNGKIEK